MSTTCRQLIVGWPRSGLGYVAKLLQQAGQDVGTGFDQRTNYSNLVVRWPKARTWEVSFALVPFLSHPDLQDTSVTFLLRDPMRVLNSLHFHGAFHGERLTPALDVASRHLPRFWEHYRGKPVQAAVAFMIGWYELAKTKRPDLRVLRVEAGNRELLQQLLGRSEVPQVYCSPDVNASGCRQLLTPAQLPENMYKPMQKMLRSLGYLDSVWNPRGGHAHYVNPDWHC